MFSFNQVFPVHELRIVSPFEIYVVLYNRSYHWKIVTFLITFCWTKIAEGKPSLFINQCFSHKCPYDLRRCISNSDSNASYCPDKTYIKKYVLYNWKNIIVFLMIYTQHASEAF